MILDEIADRITGRWAVSFRAWLYLGIIGGIGTASRTYSILGISHAESILFALAIAAITAPVYFLLSKTLLRKRFTESLSLIRVFSFYIIIWLSVGITEILITIYVFDKTALLGPQLFAPLFPDIFGFIASSYLLAEFDSNRKDISRLVFARSALAKTVQESRDQVLTERWQLISAIQDSIFFQLDGIKNQFSSIRNGNSKTEIETLANQLEDYSSNTIRKLSHEMGNDATKSEPIDRKLFIGMEKIQNFSNAYAPIISFKLTIIGVLLVGGFSQLSLNGIPGFLFQIGTAIALTPILFVGSKLTKKFSPGNIPVGFMIFLATVFLSGYVAVGISNLIIRSEIILRNPYTPTVHAARLLVLVIISSLIVTIVEARRKTLNDLEALNIQLQSELEWIDNRSSSLRSDLASILHGPLQGRIAGVAMALRLTINDPHLSEEAKTFRFIEIEKLFSKVIEDVQQLFEVKENEKIPSIIIKLIQLRRSWEGIAKVSWDISPEVFASLPYSSFSNISEILYEAISNSVRHGKAKKVKFSFFLNVNDLIIKINDDGSGVKAGFKPSLGLNKITQSGGQYSFSNDSNDGAELIVSLGLQGFSNKVSAQKVN